MQRAPKKDNTKLYYSNPKSREVLKQKVRQVFNLFDTDGSGEIDSKEFHDLLYSMGKIMTDEDVAKYLAVLDRDGNGSISFDEFFDWWCTRDNSGDNKDHSNDKLKEVKAKLQSRSLMRSISYLINKAKKDVEEEKEKIKKNTENAPAPTTGQDPKIFVVDTKVKIGDLQSENAKAALRLSYANMPSPATCYRLEFVLSEGAGDDAAERIRQIFVKGNDFIAMGMLFKDIKAISTTHGTARHVTIELTLNSAGPAEATLREVNIQKLQFSIESSQRLEDLDLKTLGLNFGIHLEASRLILALLPPPLRPSPVQSGLFSMMQRVAFEIAFKNVTEAVNSAFNYTTYFQEVKSVKSRLAENVRNELSRFGVDPNLPISELRQIFVQIEHSAFVIDITGFDLGFIFNGPAVQAPAPKLETPTPNPAPNASGAVQIPEPTLEPIAPVENKPPTFLSRFRAYEETTTQLTEQERADISLLASDIHTYKAVWVDEKTGKESSVVVDKFKLFDTTPQVQKEAYAVWQRLVGLPFIYEYMAHGYENGYTCLAMTDYIGMGYSLLPTYVNNLRAAYNTWELFEPKAKMLAQKVLNACLIFGKDYVTHAISGEAFLINPETLDMRILAIAGFRAPPVKQVPEGVPEIYFPPELFTVEGSTNYGAAVDVWMYGLFCYAVCTNNFAYAVNLETGEGAEKIPAGEWDKEAPHFTSLPEKVRNFISRCLVHDPAARPTFNELASDPWFHAN